MKKTLITIFTVLSCLVCRAGAYGSITPDGTFMYARRDSCDLYLDWYKPSEGSVTEKDGVRKPTILFVFGGGFKQGFRSDASSDPWFRKLTDEGYTVVSIDYRLGLKGVTGAGFNPEFTRNLENAIKIAVEDLFSATNYLIENAESLGIDPDAIVVSGSSAGAITVLQAEWEICNGRQLASVLPDGFNYAGVMSFSGAIFSRQGGIRYGMEPCPMMLCHGTADKIVPYGQIWFFNIRFAGSSVISRTLRRKGYNYRFYRFEGNSHEIASTMCHNFDREMDFLEENVMKGRRVIIDTTLADDGVPVPDWAKGGDYRKLYNKD